MLKPLKGVEQGILENLDSFFHLDYPSYEILFSVADAKDPVLPVLQSLLEKYPSVPASVIVGDVEVGPNPKVNNLVRSYDLARYDWILINDSNTRVDPDYLRRMRRHLRPEVGVVTAVVAGRNPLGVGGRLEAVSLNTFYARWTHLAEALGKPFVIGKSMCFRKSTAERFGGIQNLSHYIAEDNMMGQAVQRLGLKVVVMYEPIKQHIGSYEFSKFWNRHIRWGRIRKSQAPFAFFMEPLVNGLPAGVLGALAFHWFLGFPIGLFLAIHLSIWAVCDMLMISRFGSTINIKTIFAWLLREVLAFPLWLHMACGSTIQWRGNALKIMPGGLAVMTSPNLLTVDSTKDSHHAFSLGSRNEQSSNRGRKSA